MSELFHSIWFIFLSEMGDKTQLLTLVLASRFKKPWPILGGIFVASLANHALAAWGGSIVASFIPENILIMLLSALFVVFGLWLLVPDKLEEDERPSGSRGAFLTTLVVFFFAEMGDKTQLATVALGAKYGEPFLVTAGSSLGMVLANGLPALFGESFLKKVPMKWVRIFSSAVFIITGLLIYINR